MRTNSQGEPGKQGDPGLRGAKGDAGESRGPSRLQVLVAFLLLSLFCILSAFWQTHQTDGLRRAQRAAYGNCLAIQSVVLQGQHNVHASTALTADQKQQALATYATLLKHLDCAGLKP